MAFQQNTSRGQVLIDSVKFTVEGHGIKVPKRIYKYRSLDDDYHYRLIKHNEIYFADFHTFNDPFDCRIDILRGHYMSEESVLRMAEGIVSRNFNDTKGDLRIGMVQTVLKALNHDNGAEITQILKNSFHQQTQDLAYQLGIFCATPIKDNILMWAHYANNHSGVCIGFDVEKLIKQAHSFGFVEYVTRIPQFSPKEVPTLLNFLNYKSIWWDYEIEYRLSIVVENQEERKKMLPMDSINEVIFGMNVSSSHKTKTMQDIRKNNPSARFYDIIPKDMMFELECIEIT